MRLTSFRLLGRDLIVYGVMGGISRSVHLLLLPILTRHFATEEYGVVDLVAITTSVLTLAMALTLESAIARSWFEAGRKSQQAALVSSIVAFVLALGTIIVSTIWIFEERVASIVLQDAAAGPYLTLGAVTALLTALTHVPQMVLRMQRRIALYTTVTLTQTVTFASLALLLILRFDGGVLAVFAAQVAGAAFALGVGLTAIRRFVNLRVSAQWLSSSLRYSLPLVPAVVVTKINRYLDRALLLYFVGLGVVGTFAAAARVAMVISLLIEISRQAWIPFSMALIDDERGRIEFYRRALTYYAGVMAAVGLVIAAFAKELMTLLAAPGYTSAYVVIPWLMGAQILNGSAQFTNLGMLISRKTSSNSIAAWLAVGLNLGLGLVLIPRIGIWGAAVGSFVAGFALTSLLYHFSRRFVDLHIDSGKLIGIVGCYVVTCVGFIGLSELVDPVTRSLAARSVVLTVALAVVLVLSIDEPANRALRQLVPGWAKP